MNYKEYIKDTHKQAIEAMCWMTDRELEDLKESDDPAEVLSEDIASNDQQYSKSRLEGSTLDWQLMDLLKRKRLYHYFFDCYNSEDYAECDSTIQYCLLLDMDIQGLAAELNE